MRAIVPLMLIACLHGWMARAQVEYSVLPQDLQFYPRYPDGFGYARIAGQALDTTFDKVIVICSDSITKEQFTVSCQLRAQVKFDFEVPIPARLSEYDMLIALVRDDHFLYPTTVHGLVAGDVIVVAGQSNAYGYGSTDSTLIQDSLMQLRCNRTLGTNLDIAMKQQLTLGADCRFRRSCSYPIYDADKGLIGPFGMKLQQSLSLINKVPVCVILNAIGSTYIAQHQPSHTPSDTALLQATAIGDSLPPHIIYDRLFTRLHRSGLFSQLRAIVWYQGENDGNGSEALARNYIESFGTLYNAWKTDYPNLERVYVMQINTGCGGNYLDLVRGLQAQLPELFPDVRLMSTVGSKPEHRSSDGCHYTSLGFFRNAENLANLMSFDLYSREQTDEFTVTAPKIKRAWYQDAKKLMLQFSEPVAFQDSMKYLISGEEKYQKLAKAFSDNQGNSLNIESIALGNDNEIVLNLDRVGQAITSINYLPDVYAQVGALYTGPWILNANNSEIGALGFYEVPVDQGDIEDIQVYPVPSEKDITITSFRGNQIQHVALVNSLGQTLLTQEVRDSSESLDVSSLPLGIYYLQIQLEGSKKIKKIVVE